jgi:hypothetical protein
MGTMPYVVPPMADEPPGDFVAFVVTHLSDLQREAARLVGGPQYADEIYPMALSDVAGHWRRLRLQARLARRDVSGDFLIRRLATRAKQWRDDQIYEVEVLGLRPPPPPAHTAIPVSYAARKAALLPGTKRVQQRPVAEAAIAWEYAWRRARWRRIGRTVALALLVFIFFLQVVTYPPS